MSSWIDDLMSGDDFVKRDSERLHAIIRTSQKTKYVTYMGINLNLMVHNVYSHTVLGDEFIPEVYRISFSRMRHTVFVLKLAVGHASLGKPVYARVVGFKTIVMCWGTVR